MFSGYAFPIAASQLAARNDCRFRWRSISCNRLRWDFNIALGASTIRTASTAALVNPRPSSLPRRYRVRTASTFAFTGSINQISSHSPSETRATRLRGASIVSTNWSPDLLPTADREWRRHRAKWPAPHRYTSVDLYRITGCSRLPPAL